MLTVWILLAGLVSLQAAISGGGSLSSNVDKFFAVSIRFWATMSLVD